MDRKNAEYVERSNNERRGAKVINRREGEDTDVKALFASYEFEEERKGSDRRTDTDRRSH